MKTLIKILPVIMLFFGSFTTKAQNTELSFYRVDTLQSKILWKCDKHNGLIKLKTGGFVVENKQPVGGLFIVDMHSIKDLDMDPKQFGTAVLIFENTLKNEFFEANKYPYAIFELQTATPVKDDLYQITGDFTLHGITNCLSFKAHIKINDDRLIMISEKFAIDRTDWGIYRMSPKRPYADDENGWTVPDKIELQINLKASKE